MLSRENHAAIPAAISRASRTLGIAQRFWRHLARRMESAPSAMALSSASRSIEPHLRQQPVKGNASGRNAVHGGMVAGGIE
tara:strand:- start:67 stop:309 length:243 start_codon:yes stop_codon:yes gene_type:complete